MRMLGIVFLLCAIIMPAFGCAKGQHTDTKNRHYATVPDGVSPSGVTGLPPADPRR